jgi:glycosyltransferase involved in cell wall biosynthesis
MPDRVGTVPRAHLKILFFPRERFPTDRVRLTALFGRELLGRGHAIDLVMQAADRTVSVGPHAWFGRVVYVGRTCDGARYMARLRRTILAVTHDLRNLWSGDLPRYESILVSDKFLLGALACLIAKMRGQRFYFWLTYPYHHAQLALGRDGIATSRTLAYFRGYLTGALLNQWIVPRCDHLFVQSERMAADFAALGVSRSKMTPIVTGIDLEGVEPLAGKRSAMAGREITIGYLGTLVRQRRPELLIEMLHELRLSGVQARLLLVGDGSNHNDRAIIENMARDLGLSQYVEITGFLPRHVALRRIQSADICVSPFRPSPTLDVASPTKLIEYLALGIPVVANAHPDQTAVLRQSKAGVCVPWGARHFARGVRWLTRRSDADLTAMARRGQEWVASHRRYDRIADDFENACLEPSKPTALAAPN